jgi:hypothetical protein
MKPRPAPFLELSPGQKSRRWCSLPRSIGQLMTIIALSGLALAAYSEHARTRVIPLGARRFVFQPPQVPPRVEVQEPRDPSVLVAPRGVDEAMIVTAREGIDDAMIVGPARLRREAVTILPLPQSGAPGAAPRSPWQPKSRLPQSR